jgi:hypothetical protein
MKKNGIGREKFLTMMSVTTSMYSQVFRPKKGKKAKKFGPDKIRLLAELSDGSITYDDWYGKPRIRGKAA